MPNNDLISRSALIAEYDRVHVGAPGGARKLMQYAPAVDAVEVVRCKDCKYYQKTQACRYHSENELPFGFDVFMLPDDFCSYGERKGV